MNAEGRQDIWPREDRLIEFAVRIIRLAEVLPKTRVGNHVSGQIIRSGTSPAPNDGEAQSAESRVDFTHKMKICLKELRETKVWLLIIERAKVLQQRSNLEYLIKESNELIAIFVKSIQTAKQTRKQTSWFDIRYSIFDIPVLFKKTNPVSPCWKWSWS